MSELEGEVKIDQELRLLLDSIEGLALILESGLRKIEIQLETIAGELSSIAGSVVR